MGHYYRINHRLDFRGVRFPSIVGPGVRSPGVAQYISWAIEECGKGHPYDMYVKPETRVPAMYIKDAARALVMLSDAPVESIRTVMYLLDGITPTPSASELADAVRARIPDARLTLIPMLAFSVPWICSCPWTTLRRGESGTGDRTTIWKRLLTIF